ncbi:MAG: four helix bundle protein [Helicobacteraceae bacterium]|nr:four helix bundle protein [Helicobacteraceae bacterium]
MKEDNHILVKSFDFSVRIVNLCKYLQSDKKEYILSKQLIRSGTSIGANVNEAQAAQSKNDFIAKMSISSKEARESKYWIDLLIETEYLPKNSQKVISLREQNIELIKMLTSIIKSTQENNK